jgi:hypothetical protein
LTFSPEARNRIRQFCCCLDRYMPLHCGECSVFLGGIFPFPFPPCAITERLSRIVELFTGLSRRRAAIQHRDSGGTTFSASWRRWTIWDVASCLTDPGVKQKGSPDDVFKCTPSSMWQARDASGRDPIAFGSPQSLDLHVTDGLMCSEVR